MSTANSDVRWIEMYDQSGGRIQRPDTTTPQPTDRPQQPQTTKTE